VAVVRAVISAEFLVSLMPRRAACALNASNADLETSALDNICNARLTQRRLIRFMFALFRSAETTLEHSEMTDTMGREYDEMSSFHEKQWDRRHVSGCTERRQLCLVDSALPVRLSTGMLWSQDRRCVVVPTRAYESVHAGQTIPGDVSAL
jgi:hypothetical protein